MSKTPAKASTPDTGPGSTPITSSGSTPITGSGLAASACFQDLTQYGGSTMSNQKQPRAGQRQIQVELPANLDAIYSNFALITHSPSETIVDFARVLPNVPKAKVYARIVMTPMNAKLLHRALGDSRITRWWHNSRAFKRSGLIACATSDFSLIRVRSFAPERFICARLYGRIHRQMSSSKRSYMVCRPS